MWAHLGLGTSVTSLVTPAPLLRPCHSAQDMVQVLDMARILFPDCVLFRRFLVRLGAPGHGSSISSKDRGVVYPLVRGKGVAITRYII